MLLTKKKKAIQATGRNVCGGGLKTTMSLGTALNLHAAVGEHVLLLPLGEAATWLPPIHPITPDTQSDAKEPQGCHQSQMQMMIVYKNPMCVL